ncbi:hypothetical protein SERLADRAFT_407043 [Serpula lacrymans var. lacrymans S7.9]|uniref:Uncharacterized protein n=1 Tax=Serpula lacrymans var. lacrymans (strain S7.9) TaxID=578457 RepID=F8NQS5_SERL9|nr:uncharacterized protein SERLADRAFT_407043 [Serpula lacrymans var. lacrymans S7.9]EGO26151.1 hypothetical protein SERLADRAFT_407043 [Serpula lacrymans var. lacrymans S7.9]
MATLTIANASWTGIRCTLKAQDTVKARVVSTYSHLLTILLVVLDMLPPFIDIKQLNNTLRFGMLITTFFRNHYHEASKAINTLTAELEIIKVELHLTETDFEWFYAEEQKHLTTLTQYPVKDQLYTRYIETLDELHTRQNEWGNARQMANNALSTSHSGSIQDINNALLQARIRVDNAYARLQNSEKNVSDLEVQLCIKERWAIGSTEYNRYQEAKSISKYQTTVDNLECLTVMRLFELSKILMPGTGLDKTSKQGGLCQVFKLCRAREEIVWLNVEMHWKRGIGVQLQDCLATAAEKRPAPSGDLTTRQEHAEMVYDAFNFIGTLS